jgi:hypothetical protein
VSGDGSEFDEDDGTISVALPIMSWAEVCAALKHYIATGTKDAPVSRRDALESLREIDRVLMGKDEQAPPDDVLGVGEGS